jgi:Ca2+-binding EF-hand superfamily protein
LFRAYDKDGSESISFREFIIFLSITSPTQKDRDLEKLIEVTFTLYDANGDGFLDAEELTNGMLDSFKLLGHNVEAKRFQNVVQSRVKKIVSVADANNDGVVSLAEIKDACSRDPELLKLF